MAAPLHNNLPPQSQQWVRDIERRMKTLEQQNQLLQVTANQNATTIGAVQEGLGFARSGALSVSLTDFGVGSGGVSPTGSVPVPEWARSVTLMLTVGSYGQTTAPWVSGTVVASAIAREMNPGGDLNILSTPDVTTRITPTDTSLQMNFTRYIVSPIMEGSTEILYLTQFNFSAVSPGRAVFFLDAVAIFSATPTITE